MVTKDEIMTVLHNCHDTCGDDWGISVVDMGLIEDVRIEGPNVYIDMVLTTGWCPFVARMFITIQDQVRQLESAENVKIQVLWDRPWTMDRLSESARKKLMLPMEQLLPLREKRLAAQKGE